MELISVDTQHAYEKIREQIIMLQLPPGSIVNEQALSAQLELGAAPVREALKLLVHDNLIEISKHHGVYVSGICAEDLDMLSEVRVLLEAYAARLAAQRATEDDIMVMEALIEEQKGISPEDKQAWFDIDHKLHQAIANAARNHYLVKSLDYYFGLSQRLWFLALPKINFLAQAVEEHADILERIKNKQPERAEHIMAAHVEEFYNKVHQIVSEYNRMDLCQK